MKGTRSSLVAAAAVVFTLLLSAVAPRAALADAKVKKEIEQKVKEALETYDLLEYEEARKMLNAALAAAKKAKMAEDPVVAQVHLALGIVYFAGLNEPESAKLAFLSAVEIDATVEIPAAYKTPDMAALLDEARAEFGGGGGGGDDGASAGGEDEDCGSVTGLQHEIEDTAEAGKAKKLSARLGGDARDGGAVRVAIMYRPQGAEDFVVAEMSRKGECTYVGSIPASGLRGELAHYYVAAYNGEGKVVVSRGSMGSPNILEISGGGGGGGGDEENPLGDGGGDVSGSVDTGPRKPAKVYLNVAFGTGVGFVTGKTEQAANDVACCFAPALLHVLPELGLYIAPKTALGLAFRLGFPIGANIENHSTAAPAAVLRFRHSLGSGQEGLSVTGALGGGVMRNTIKVTTAAPGMDTDIVALGPLLVGGGAAYTKGLGGPVRFVSEFNALIGVPVIGKLGSNPGFNLNFGVQFDLSLGLQFGF
jgi:hypothetical protein